jgi:hypothetical protein
MKHGLSFSNPKHVALLTLSGLATAGILLSASLGLATSPPGHFSIGQNALADTVTDNATKLMWTRKAADPNKNWADASTYCADLIFAGFSDWRLGTIKELQTLVDDSRVKPALDTDAFPALGSSGLFWSSTSMPWSSDWISYLDISSGGVGTYSSADSKNFEQKVLCVRNLN